MAVFRYSGNWRGYLEGSSSTVSQNIANNSSVIKVDVWIGMDAGWSIEFGNTYGNTVTVTCDGQSQTLAVGPLYLNGSKKHLGSVQFTVGHNADGTKTAGIGLSSNMSNINYADLRFGNASGSWNHGLSTIPRSSSLSFGTGTIGSPLAITIGRASSSFTHTLRWAWGSRSGTIATGVGTSASWNIPMDFCNELPNNVSGTGTIFLDTYSGSTRVGTQSRQFTANVPASVIPSFTGVTLDDQNATAKALITGNSFVQIMSNIKVTFNGAAGTYGSTIKGFRAEVVGRNLAVTSNGGTFGAMNFNGTATIRASVTDSRGRTSAARDVTISLLEYFAPVISIQVLRTRENPNTLQVLRTIKVAPLTFGGVNKNSAKLAFEVAPLGSTSFVADNGAAGGEWTTIFTLTNSGANLAGTYTSTSSWTVRAKLSDKFTISNPTIVSSDVGTESVIHGYDKDGRFGVGKTPELGPPGSVDAAGEYFSKGKKIQHYMMTSDVGGGLANSFAHVDDVKTPGVWQIGADKPGNPFGTFCILECFKLHTSMECIQRVTTTSGFMAVREFGYDSVWRPWRYVAQSSNVPSKNADHPMLQEKPLKTLTMGFPYGLNATLTRKDNLVTISLNRRITNIDVFEYRQIIETIPLGYRPTAEAHMVIVPNSGSFTKSPSILHFASDGKIRLTNGTGGAHAYTGTITYITNDPYPS
ncbi:TPA: hypothetical protein U1X84_002376 [Streptococcus suis]|nr:hypothetical protein [Streptococcus suis]HEM4286148.1 hypothetical protein [Streptococcus suis]